MAVFFILVYLSFIWILLFKKYVHRWYIFSYKRYANNIVLNISNVEDLLKWFVQNSWIFLIFEQEIVGFF